MKPQNKDAVFTLIAERWNQLEEKRRLIQRLKDTYEFDNPVLKEQPDLKRAIERFNSVWHYEYGERKEPLKYALTRMDQNKHGSLRVMADTFVPINPAIGGRIQPNGLPAYGYGQTIDGLDTFVNFWGPFSGPEARRSRDRSRHLTLNGGCAAATAARCRMHSRSILNWGRPARLSCLLLS